MYFDDMPIKSQENDLLNRREFAKNLGKTLLDMDAKNGYCIGLFGPWGSGKSSIINMILEEVRIQSEVMESTTVLMSFNPWNFSSSDQLIKQYFIMLADRLTSATDKRLSKVGKAVQRYAGMFDVFGDVGKGVGKAWKAIGKILQLRDVCENEDITKQRNQIVEALAGQKCKIIVVIDDIDRLSNKEIKLVFQLVNSVAKFPNIIYLLSFDKEIVSRALGEVQNCDGEKYLEKIVQVPIEIPEVSNDRLLEILFDKLNQVYESYPEMLFEQEYWNRVFYECISKYIHTIRDIVRLANGLSIKCGMIGAEVNFADMVAITVIENQIPELYGWIKDNKEKLVGSSRLSLKFAGKSEKEIASLYEEEMHRLNEGRCEEYINLLKFFFPYYAAKISAGSSYRVHENGRRNLRIGHADIIDRYFALELDNEDIPRKEFNYAFEEMDEQELIIYFKKLSDEKRVMSFLRELDAARNELQIGRIRLVVEALLRSAVDFEDGDKQRGLGVSAFSMTLYIVRDILLKLDSEEERYSLLKGFIQKADKDSIQTIAYFINIIELAFGRLSANGIENGGEKLINIEQLEDCERKLVKKISELSTTYNILDMKYARLVLYMYEELDKRRYVEYMSKCLEDDINKLRFVGFSAERWTSGSVVSWRWNDEYKKMLDDEAFKSAFQNCLNDKRIWLMGEEDLHRVVSFMLRKEKVTEWDGSIPDSKVQEAIKRLEEEYA